MDKSKEKFFEMYKKVTGANVTLNEEKKWIQKADVKKGALHKRLGIPEDQKIPMSLINSEIKKLNNKEKDGQKLSSDELKFKRQLELAKTFKKMDESFNNSTDYLKGGLADNADVKYDKNQLVKGMLIELEHTDNPKIALEIAMDHLVEDNKYYDHLEDMEKKFSKNE